MKLNLKAFALAAGILWGIGVLFILGVAGQTGYLSEFAALLTASYPYTGTDLAGSIIGGAFGFVDAAIGGAIFVWLYNKLA